MKRELNSRSRRKWVVGGAMVFGSIALLSTGFATWVIGVTRTNDDETIAPGVDTISTDSFIVSAALPTGAGANNTIQIGDSKDISGFMSNTGDNLDLTFDLDLTVERQGNNKAVKPGAVEIRVKGDTGKVAKTDLPNPDPFSAVKSDTEVDVSQPRTEDSWTVLGYDSHTAVTWSEANVANDTYTYTATTHVTLELDRSIWGDADSICDFYNQFYTKPVAAQTFDYVTNAKTAIEADLNAIIGALSHFTVTVTVATAVAAA